MPGFAVVTISDRCAAGQQVDTTGPAVARLLAEQWPEETIGRGLVPDNEDAIETLLHELCHQEYELVLSDLQMESPEAGLKVLAHARNMDYKPATAIVTTYQNHQHFKPLKQSRMLIKPEDLPGLLAKVANLISDRATRRVLREMRHAAY